MSAPIQKKVMHYTMVMSEKRVIMNFQVTRLLNVNEYNLELYLNTSTLKRTTTNVKHHMEAL